MNHPLKKSNISTQNEDIALYQSEDGEIEFHVNVFNETVWLTQKQIAKLLDVDVRTISEHINNCVEEQEIEEESAIRKLRIAQIEGNREVSRFVHHYNVDVILSVGYRVKSPTATCFRKWSSKVLNRYIIDGYAINHTKIHAIEEKEEN